MVGTGSPALVEVSIDSTARGENMAWVITDANLTIISLPTGPPFDFDDQDTGICLIWHISFDGDFPLVAVGANASALEGCFDLSEPVVVLREAVPAPECLADGGSITTERGDSFTICTGDGKSDSFDVQLTGASGTNSAWVLTDPNGRIIALPSSPPFDLESSGDGVVQIWHLSYEDDIQGASLSANVANLRGCFDLSNPITVTRQLVRGGTVRGPNGVDEIIICSGDGRSDAFDLSIVGSRGGNARWIVTDTSGTILQTNAAQPFDFDNSPQGVLLIWHFSFNGEITGLEVGQKASDLSGCFALSNAFRVTTTGVNGGEIATLDGETEVSICAEDNIVDFVNVSLSGASGTNSAWVITDAAGIITELLNVTSFNLETGSGSAFIWHLSFEDGLVGAEIGANANNLQGCFDLSNAIKVNILRGDDCPAPCEISGGSLSTTDGLTELTICAGDDIPDPFNVVVEGATGALNAWVITDTSGNILGLPIGPPFDLDQLGGGIAQIWHLSYEADAVIPSIGGRVEQLRGCFALSNPIIVTRLAGDDCPPKCEIEAGQISFENGSEEITICVDDDQDDLINAIVTGVDAPNTGWLITNELGTILALLDELPYNFEGTGSGSSFLWHIGFDESLSGAVVGQNASGLTGCFDLSNSIKINKNIEDNCERCDVDGGTLISTDGNLDIAFCAEEAIFEIGHLTEEKQAPYYYVITDGNGLILDWQPSSDRIIDLRNSGPGNCRVYGWSTSAGRLPNLGDPIGSLTIGCGELSANFVSVTKQENDDCDKGCHAPRNLRVRKVTDNRFTVQWQRVDEADSYIVRLRYVGDQNQVVEIPVRGRKVNVIARPDQEVEISVAAVCNGDVSNFGPIQRIDTNTKSRVGKSRTEPKGLFDVNEFEVVEQAILFPNPAVSLMSVYYDGDDNQGFLEIFDINGRRVQSMIVAPYIEVQMVDVSTLEEGMYFLTITSGGDQIVREKFVKAKQ